MYYIAREENQDRRWRKKIGASVVAPSSDRRGDPHKVAVIYFYPPPLLPKKPLSVKICIPVLLWSIQTVDVAIY